MFPVKKMDTNNDCGITALQQIAQYFGRSVTKPQIAIMTGFNYRHNLTDTPGHLIRGLIALNIPFALVQSKLMPAIANSPCIVLKQYGFAKYHYEVYFTEDDQLWVSDGDGMAKPVDFNQDQHQPKGLVNAVLKTSNLVFICGIDGGDGGLKKHHLMLARLCDWLVKIGVNI